MFLVLEMNESQNGYMIKWSKTQRFDLKTAREDYSLVEDASLLQQRRIVFVSNDLSNNTRNKTRLHVIVPK